jgi:hypothetical protein
MRAFQNLMIVPAVAMSFVGSLGIRGIFRALRGCYLEYRQPIL